MWPSRGSLNFFAEAFLEGAAAAMQAAKSINTKPILMATNLEIFMMENFVIL